MPKNAPAPVLQPDAFGGFRVYCDPALPEYCDPTNPKNLFLGDLQRAGGDGPGGEVWRPQPASAAWTTKRPWYRSPEEAAQALAAAAQAAKWSTK